MSFINKNYMSTIKKFEDLEVWKLARELCQDIFSDDSNVKYAWTFRPVRFLKPDRSRLKQTDTLTWRLTNFLWCFLKPDELSEKLRNQGQQIQNTRSQTTETIETFQTTETTETIETVGTIETTETLSTLP